MHIKKILLVEDTKLPQLIVKSHFEKLNCIVDVADTGEQGVEYSLKQHYQLILLDIGLPGIDGFTAAEMIRQKNNSNQQTPIIALTAHDDSTLKTKALAAGMNDYLIKPLTFQMAQEVPC